MTIADMIYERAKTLPETQARKVLDFLERLQVKTQAPTTIPPQETSVGKPENLPGLGMWANRNDISDSGEYLRKVRKPRYSL